MDGEAGAAGLNGFGELAGAAILLGELRERDRRRVLVDPASKVLDSGVLRHARSWPGSGSDGDRRALERLLSDIVGNRERNSIRARRPKVVLDRGARLERGIAEVP